MQYWLLKTEPGTYSWDDLVRDKKTAWTGVRNFQARNHLRAMERGDLAFIYHSGEEKAIVGVAQVSSGPHADATASDGDWTAVDIAPREAAARPLPLGEIKREEALGEMVLVRNSRLSVQPVTREEWDACLALMKNKKK